MNTPKTITLYGHGTRRYRIVPGVWADCLKAARRLKAWAKRVKDDRKWYANACVVSREHLTHVLATDVTDLAKEDYRYLRMRAHLGYPECWDRPARVRWIKLGGRLRRPKQLA
jgi:hypothetical protein